MAKSGCTQSIILYSPLLFSFKYSGSAHTSTAVLRYCLMFHMFQEHTSKRCEAGLVWLYLCIRLHQHSQTLGVSRIGAEQQNYKGMFKYYISKFSLIFDPSPLIC